MELKKNLTYATLSLFAAASVSITAFTPLAVHAEETMAEKAKNDMKDTGKDIKRGARHAKHKICKEGDMDCKQKDTLKDKAGDAKEDIKDGATKVKDKVD